MTLEITHLGSGSSGNSAAYRSEDAIVVIDCGFSMKQMEKRLILADIEPSDVDHILVTHHHMDHSKSAMRASKSWGARLHSNLVGSPEEKRNDGGNSVSSAPTTLTYNDLKIDV